MTQIFRAKKIFISVFFIIVTFNLATAQLGIWNQKANFGGFARARCLSFSIGTKGYIGTGENGSPTSDLWEYDQQNNTWTQKANVGNTGRTSGVGFSIGNKGYAGLGSSSGQPLNDFWEYNPVTNTWIQKASFPGTGKLSAVAFSIDNFGYVGTGSPSGPIGNETKEFWQYNPVNNSWLRKADFGGTQRDRAVGFSINSKGYIGTGYGFTEGNPVSFGDFWEYDPTNNLWTEKATVPQLVRNNAVGFSTASRGYIGMGYLNKTDFWQYDPNSNSWIQVSSFNGAGRIFPSAFSIGNRGYVGMGYSVVGSQGTTIYYNDIWEYVEQTLSLDQNDFQRTFEVYPNPSFDIINILVNSEINQIIIYDCLGKEKLKSNNKSINISSLDAGIYYVKVINSTGESIKKIIKK